MYWRTACVSTTTATPDVRRLPDPEPNHWLPTGSAFLPAWPAPAPPTSRLNHSASHAHICHPPAGGTPGRAIATAWRPALDLACSPHTMLYSPLRVSPE